MTVYIVMEMDYGGEYEPVMVYLDKEKANLHAQSIAGYVKEMDVY